MTSTAYKLICETPADQMPVEVLWEEDSLNKPKNLFVQGPYMGGGIVNKNKRLYPVDEMRMEVTNFINDKVKKNIATGELNHPDHANLDLKQAAHLITQMWEDNNVWYGKSKVLNDTPNGELLKSLLKNGVAIGMSSRCLGQLSESGQGYSTVHNMKMVTVDAVADPSFDKAFVNGILESKQFVCESDGSFRIESCYNNLESALDDMPRGQRDNYIVNAVKEFLKSFNA
jgi:hypothetical protein